MDSNFVHLASGVAINKNQITHIDFHKPVVAIHVGPNTVQASGDDALKLREMFEPSPEERATEAKTRAEKKKAVADKTAAQNKAADDNRAANGELGSNTEPAKAAVDKRKAEVETANANAK